MEGKDLFKKEESELKKMGDPGKNDTVEEKLGTFHRKVSATFWEGPLMKELFRYRRFSSRSDEGNVPSGESRDNGSRIRCAEGGKDSGPGSPGTHVHQTQIEVREAQREKVTRKRRGVT